MGMGFAFYYSKVNIGYWYGYPKIIQPAGYKKWKVYAKSPIGNVVTVVEYLERYIHKIAITAHRIISKAKT